MGERQPATEWFAAFHADVARVLHERLESHIGASRSGTTDGPELDVPGAEALPGWQGDLLAVSSTGVRKVPHHPSGDESIASTHCDSCDWAGLESLN